MGIAELIGVYSEVLSIFTEDHRMRVLNTWLLGPILACDCHHLFA